MAVETSSSACQDDQSNPVHSSIELLGFGRPMKTEGHYPFTEKDMQAIERRQLVQALDSAPTIWDSGGVKVVRIAPNAVVKYGYGVKILEARNMVFVAQHTAVRLPHVFDAWVERENSEIEDGNDMCFIVMSYIDGLLLDEAWPELCDARREDVQQQLHQFIRELRQTESALPGPVGGGVSNGAFFTDYGAGPFTSREEMEAWFDERLAVCCDFGVVDNAHPGFHKDLQRLTMCHMDLHDRSIILDRHANIWLIDWAFARMYPAYFETATISRYGRQRYSARLLDLLGDEMYSKEVDHLFSITFALTTGAFCKPSGKPDHLASLLNDMTLVK